MPGQKVSSLLALAEEDLAVATNTSNPARIAAYHLSQAAEKAARAVCEHAGIQVGTTHNIGQIGAMLAPDHPFRTKIEAQNYHSSASTKYRYPDAAGRLPTPPSPEELERRIADVSAFLDEVSQFVVDKSEAGNKSV